ncbi:MAG: helix-turn-helix domain-containing protein [Methylocella sp.]
MIDTFEERLARVSGKIRRINSSRYNLQKEALGRTPSLTPQQQAEARQRRAEGATLKDLARSYNVSMATISRLRT